MIKKNGFNINKIKASGKNGRVMKEDVLKYIESGKALKD
jgi:pyruvate/2-oxoglutarate dehydrogenase complex dihydrolipoamide acyltransferase (E2) component